MRSVPVLSPFLSVAALAVPIFANTPLLVASLMLPQTAFLLVSLYDAIRSKGTKLLGHTAKSKRFAEIEYYPTIIDGHKLKCPIRKLKWAQGVLYGIIKA